MGPPFFPLEADFLVAVVFFTAGFLPVLAALGVAFLPVLFLALLAAGFLALLLGVLAGATGATAAGAGATTSGAGAGACALDAILRVVLASFLLLVGFFASFLAAGLRLTFLAGLLVAILRGQSHQRGGCRGAV